MRGRVLIMAAAVLAAGVLVAQNPKYQQDAGWRPPQTAATRRNPLPPTQEVLRGGQKLFQRNCAECHGDDGSGRKKAADFLLPSVQQQSDGVLFWKITNGNPGRGMPSFARLPEPQRWQLVLYIRSLGRQ